MMDKQKRQAIGQMIIAAFIGAAVIIPGMVAVNAATAKEQAEQAAIAEQTKQAAIEEIAEIKVVEEEPVTLIYWEDIPLDAHLQNYIVEQSKAHGIQPEIIMAMIKRESNYKADTIGDKGNSFGLMQIQVRWHYRRMLKLDCTNLLDPYQNVTVGIDYLAELLEKYGDIGKALTAYNQGSYKGTVTQYAKAVMETAVQIAE